MCFRRFKLWSRFQSKVYILLYAKGKLIRALQAADVKTRLRICYVLNEKEFEDTKGVIRIRKLKKNRQHNGQQKKDKQRSTKHKHKTKDPITRTPLKSGVNSGAPKG
jgi:hypothetical protein